MGFGAVANFGGIVDISGSTFSGNTVSKVCQTYFQ